MTSIQLDCGISARSVAKDEVFYVKIGPETQFQRSYGHTSSFCASLWAAPLLERPRGPLDVVVRPEAAHKRIRQNPSLATPGEDWGCQASQRENLPNVQD